MHSIYAIFFLCVSITISAQTFETDIPVCSSGRGWTKDLIWHEWKNFRNLFIYRDSLFCTYNNDLYNSGIIALKEGQHYYQWFPVFKSPVLSILPNQDFVEAWTTYGYMRSSNLLEWEKLPNQHNDLSWCSVRWNNYSVWGLEEFGRSGIIFAKNDSLYHEEVEDWIDVRSLGIDQYGNLYAGLGNNKIYERTPEGQWHIFRELPNDGSHLRMIRFINGIDFVGTNQLFVNGEPVLECLPSDILYHNSYYLLSTYNKGIFISEDGKNFFPWNENLGDLGVWSIIIFNNHLFAATKSGIFRREIHTVIR